MSRNKAKFKTKRRYKGNLNLKLKIYIFLMVMSYGSHGCAGSRLEHGEQELRSYATKDQGSGQADRSMEGLDETVRHCGDWHEQPPRLFHHSHNLNEAIPRLHVRR